MKLFTALVIALAFFGRGMECSVAVSSDPASTHPLLRQTVGPVGPVAFNGVGGGNVGGVATKFDQSQVGPSKLPPSRGILSSQYDPSKSGQGKWTNTAFDPTKFSSNKGQNRLDQSKFASNGFKRPQVQGSV
jgi:hypothetical protein